MSIVVLTLLDLVLLWLFRSDLARMVHSMSRHGRDLWLWERQLRDKRKASV